MVLVLCLQSDISKRIEEKGHERDSFEHRISNVDLSRIDERERHLVRGSLLYGFRC